MEYVDFCTQVSFWFVRDLNSAHIVSESRIIPVFPLATQTDTISNMCMSHLKCCRKISRLYITVLNEQSYQAHMRLVGLGVWFSLWVREVPGSNPGRAHFPLIYNYVIVPFSFKHVCIDKKSRNAVDCRPHTNVSMKPRLLYILFTWSVFCASKWSSFYQIIWQIYRLHTDIPIQYVHLYNQKGVLNEHSWRSL